MLINMWYVAEWSKTLKDEPVQVKMLGRNFVLFRDKEGKANCLSDVCLHRGGSLSGGWTNDNCVVCPYHGWRFGGDGVVKYIPSEGDDFTPPVRARVDSYPTEEHYGMVWVFLGDIPAEERYPIPAFPEFGNSDWKALQDEWTWNAESARVIENGIDIAHASFVHPMFGRPETAQVNQILSVEKGEGWGKSENLQFPPQLKGNFLRRRMRKDKQPTTTKPEFNLAGALVRIQIDINTKMSIIMFDCNTPVDEHTTRTFATQLRSFFKADLFDKGSRKRLIKIFEEDAAVIERASPNYLPDSLANELSVKDDKFMSYYRAARRKCIEEKGWKIDVKATREHDGVKVLTIPSPMRREHPDVDWVMDTVPLVPALKDAIAATAE